MKEIKKKKKKKRRTRIEIAKDIVDVAAVAKPKLYKFKIVIKYDETCTKALERSSEAGKTMGWLTVKITPDKEIPKHKAQQVLLQTLMWLSTGNPNIMDHIEARQKTEQKKGSRFVV